MTRIVIGIFLLAVTFIVARVASAQVFPNKPIRIITGPASGGSDSMARLIAQGLSSALEQPVIVENRATIASNEIAAKATPDGYTLLVSGSSLWVSPLLQHMPFDPVRDFAPITLTDRVPNILVVYPPVLATSVRELIALAKAKPGALNYAAGQTGTTAHLAGELFKDMAGVNIVAVPYKGSAANITALLAGEVQLAFGQPLQVTPHLKSGRLRALAVASTEPSVRFPNLPTVAATLPGFESVQSQGIFAPARTPAAVINRVNQASVRFLMSAETREKILNAGSEVVGSTPAGLATAIRSEMKRLSKVIKDAGIKVE